MLSWVVAQPYNDVVAVVEVTGSTNIEVAVGDELVIRLKENATTGYEWSADVPRGLVLLADERHVGGGAGERPDGVPSVPGAGGERVFRLRVAAPVQGSIALRLRREWEGTPLDEVQIGVLVRGEPSRPGTG